MLLVSACQAPAPRPPAEVVDRTVRPAPGTAYPGDAPRVRGLSGGGYIAPDESGGAALDRAGELLDQGQAGMAQALLAGLDPLVLDIRQQDQMQQLRARAQLVAGGAGEALEILAAPPRSGQAGAYAGYHLTRAEAQLALARPAAGVRELVQATGYLGAADAADVTRLTWNALQLVDLATLRQLAGEPSTVLAGWADLALSVRSASSNYTTDDYQRWRTAHPGHPADTYLAPTDLAQAAGKPRRVALLLPLSSPYGKAAGAIRDGITAINADRPAAQRLDLAFYDYGRDPNLVALYYRQAVNDGAELVIGPLGREAVSQLLTAAELDARTILLSPAPEFRELDDHVFQLTLSPEQEARQVAEHAWRAGYRDAAVMTPDDNLGQRAAGAFREQFTRLGGNVIAEAGYQAGQVDFSAPIRSLLDVDGSEQRMRELARLLDSKLVYEPRRRQDIDFIFLPATTQDARLIKPVLDYYYALDLPIYATSQLFSGQLDPVNDADLNRIRFPDMPWMVATNVQIDSLRTFLQGDWSLRDTHYNRLYALGMDLHAIATYITPLGNDGRLNLQGVSGRIHGATGGELQRELLWAVFRDGRPTLMEGSDGYQGRFANQAPRQSARPPR